MQPTEECRRISLTMVGTFNTVAQHGHCDNCTEPSIYTGNGPPRSAPVLPDMATRFYSSLLAVLLSTRTFRYGMPYRVSDHRVPSKMRSVDSDQSLSPDFFPILRSWKRIPGFRFAGMLNPRSYGNSLYLACEGPLTSELVVEGGQSKIITILNSL